MTEFGPAGIRFTDYPFPPSTACRYGTVAVADIRDADPDAAPPEVRLHTGETLFVDAGRRDDLRAFCQAHAIPCRRRPDVWGALLEPFLDTEFTPADEARTAAILARAGIDAAETAHIRASVGDAMVAYNFESMLWDWVHLGLWDLLQAWCGHLSGERHRLTPEDFTEAYGKAMAVADRGHQSDQNSSHA